jgi:hypothetical protein
MIAQAPSAAAVRIHVCPGCGVIVPTQTGACAICSTRVGAGARGAEGGVGNAVWACIVECDVECRACGLRTPVRGLHMAGEISCERCGQIQAFEPNQWREALGHAHEVVVFHGRRAMETPQSVTDEFHPELLAKRRTELAAIGFTTATAELIQGKVIARPAGFTMRLKVGPGHPLCAQCREPLGAGLDEGGRMQTVCARCGDLALYGLPQGAREIYRPVRGTIAMEQRIDRAPAKVDRSAGGLVALRCPNCGAAISLGSSSDVVTCSHCNKSSAVPRQALARPGVAPLFTAFWVLLEAPYNRYERLSPGELQWERGALAGRPAPSKSRDGVGLTSGDPSKTLAVIVVGVFLVGITLSIIIIAILYVLL